MSQQLVKKGTNGKHENVMPRSWIEAIKDKNTGQTLVEILQGFNMYFLPYNGNTSTTRCLVPTMLRKKGLWITYVKYDGNVYTEWYASEKIDDNSWGNSSNWRIGNNTLVGDITISANGNWVINGTETEFKAVGEKGNTPLIRVANNRLQVSYDLGDTYIDVTNNPVYTKFRWLATSGDTQSNNVGRIQASTDEGKTWTNMSNDFTNNLHISRYIGVNESLPTSGIAEGTIYAKGPYYAEGDTLNDNPIYRLWVYAWKGDTLAWQDNGEFTSIAAGVVQETGNSETEVMSQKAVTEKLSELGSKVVDVIGLIQSENEINGYYDSSSLESPKLHEDYKCGNIDISTIEGWIIVCSGYNNENQFTFFQLLDGSHISILDITGKRYGNILLVKIPDNAKSLKYSYSISTTTPVVCYPIISGELQEKLVSGKNIAHINEFDLLNNKDIVLSDITISNDYKVNKAVLECFICSNDKTVKDITIHNIWKNWDGNSTLFVRATITYNDDTSDDINYNEPYVDNIVFIEKGHTKIYLLLSDNVVSNYILNRNAILDNDIVLNLDKSVILKSYIKDKSTFNRTINSIIDEVYITASKKVVSAELRNLWFNWDGKGKLFLSSFVNYSDGTEEEIKFYDYPTAIKNNVVKISSANSHCYFCFNLDKLPNGQIINSAKWKFKLDYILDKAKSPLIGNWISYNKVEDIVCGKQDELKLGEIIATINGVPVGYKSSVTIGGNNSGSGNIYQDRPPVGYLNFTVDVNSKTPYEQNISVNDNTYVGKDYGIIVLPTNYSKVGKGVPLIIDCHGSGHDVTLKSTKTTHSDYFSSQGYAVLDMNCSSTKRGLIGNGGLDYAYLHLGNPTVLQSLLKGIEYISTIFNIDCDNIFVVGYSMGALAATQLVLSNAIKVKACALISPVLDIARQAFMRPWNGWDDENKVSGTFLDKQKEWVSDYFGFEGQKPTFTNQKGCTEEELSYLSANYDKLIGYNPMWKYSLGLDFERLCSVNVSNDFTETEEEKELYKSASIIFPTTLRIWHTIDDSVVAYYNSKEYVSLCRRAGSSVWLRSVATGGHTWNNEEVVSNIPTINGGTINANLKEYEIIEYFKGF